MTTSTVNSRAVGTHFPRYKQVSRSSYPLFGRAYDFVARGMYLSEGADESLGAAIDSVAVYPLGDVFPALEGMQHSLLHVQHDVVTLLPHLLCSATTPHAEEK